MNVWEARWLRAFHLLYHACLALGLILSLGEPSGPGPAALGILAVMAAWHWFFVVRRPHLLGRPNPMAFHLVVICGLYAALVMTDRSFDVVIFGLMPQPYLMLAGPWSYVGAVATVLTTFVARGHLDKPDAIWQLAGSSGLVLAIGLFVNYLTRQSEQNRAVGVLEERARLAREIHDTIAQGLSGIITQLEAAEQAMPELAAVQKRITLAKELARDNLQEARRSVDALRPRPLADARLDAALAEVAERWSRTSGTTATVAVEGTPRPLAGEVAAALLRAAQEGLSNVAKHASADRVAITLTYMEDEVTLDVYDDGNGFDPAVPRAGYGLAAMRERAGTVGGTLTVESAPGEGTALCLRIPSV
ncbi:sensor histidine kinase [Nonomuraea jiangxiensis]|uniref:Oxygen sensor histidine kinase NreB n=1 Tax=Nonomuraea jiangxiensis TaxID=633440 RepID=A0A1G9RB13_9ACTN|nr:sensor histidine kinase [Nonomuraea jiangxiensis]SDM20456.1 Histidine kinase-, DNA gyrase B-, and HSP90-like ATPase [Nonomuraea jiangxiensis]